ncbi:MAG: DUF3379 family protein [Gammaproteobacteria bacterium]|nr:DUF3379 family protein [Gammaproteobacteria bacterium]MDP7455478.1 DUF3379 family protein [Gammaproteobacteria bacterium]
MDELEFQKFKKIVYADPGTEDPEVLQAARANPELQKLVDDMRELDTSVAATLSGIPIPAGLAENLLAIPEVDTAVAATESPAPAPRYHYYALAACLILAVGITIGFNLNRGPTSSNLAFGDNVLKHIYVDVDLLNSAMAESATMTFPVVNQVMANAGSRLNDNGLLQNTPVRFALPCEVIPSFQSTHLAVQGNAGTVNIIVINNSPVNGEFTIRDDRYDGIVIPMDQGNMILIGERNEDLDQYKDLFSDSIDWVI